MSEQPSRVPVRFCPACGEAAAGAANYCAACGAALRARGATAAAPATGAPPFRTAGIVVLVAFLAVGLSLWFLILRPEAPSRMPLAPKPQAQAGGGAPQAQGGLPADHPPIEIPSEVRTFIADLEKKANESPQDGDTWRRLAEVQYRAGQVDKSYLAKAEASFRRVLEIDPKNLEALRGLGNVYFDRDEYGRAVETYQSYLALRPDDANVRTDLGTMYLYGGKVEDAIREYRAVIAKDPNFYQAHFNLGIALHRSGDAAAARATFEKAKELAPDGDTKAQIQAMIDRSAGAPPGGAGPPGGGGGLADRVEKSVRAHPVAGPKVVRLEWPKPTEGRVVLDSFPMEAMPEFARQRFLDRLKEDLAVARRDASVSDPVKLEIVDLASGKVMATVAVP